MDSSQWMELSHAAFCDIRDAKKRLEVVVGIEEKLDLVLANYIEYEQELQGLALQASIFQSIDWRSFRQDINRINRRVVNLLSATRLYLDQVSHDISSLPLTALAHRTIEDAIQSEYDGRFSCRFVDALRNNVQHRVMPVHELTYKMSWDEVGEPREMAVRVFPNLTVARLLTDFKFKPSIKKELSDSGRDHLILTPLIREYVEAIGRVHEVFRKAIQGEVAQWEATLQSALTKAKDRWGDEAKFLAVVAEENRRYVHTEHLVLELSEHRDSLVRKNRVFNNLSRRYVCTSCREDR